MDATSEQVADFSAIYRGNLARFARDVVKTLEAQAIARSTIYTSWNQSGVMSATAA